MKEKYQRSICWVRRDLRLSDHRSLYEACKHSEEVIIVFVFDKSIINKLPSKKDSRLQFISESIEVMNQGLQKYHSKVLCLYGDPAIEIPKLAESLKVQSVFANRDYESYAKARDLKVQGTLRKKNIEFYSFKDHVIFEGEEIQKEDGTAYKVFTPYKRKWLEKLSAQELVNFKPDYKKLVDPKTWGAKKQKFALDTAESLLPAGEVAAQKKITRFVRQIRDYDKQRDFPSIDGTSGISTYLRFGNISIREAARISVKNKSKGSEVWLSELIWRDFYQMILQRFPFVETSTFLPQYKDIQWPGKTEHFEAWCQGKTGYPIVDAAMRQLNQTGWMHNRLRMITASFLVKDLLIDWRLGEKYFAQKLMDYDLASNNGGWQWCASTGCDAQPYFRIFNPITQSQKFDPQGDFIRKYVPELAKLSDKEIHGPHRPIVEHSEQRMKAILLYKK